MTKQAVTRAIRLQRPHDAASAVSELREAFPGHGRGLRLSLLDAMESAGVREGYANALIRWMLGSNSRTSPPPYDPYELPSILIEPGQIFRMIGSLESALADGHFNLFWMAGRLVCLATQRDPGDVESTCIQQVSETLLIEYGTKAARWIETPAHTKIIRRDGQKVILDLPDKVVDCPKAYAQGLLAQHGLHHATFQAPPGSAIEQGVASSNASGASIPQLIGLANAPTLRRDGSLIDLPGYDTATGLYLSFDADFFPAIPDRPTVEQSKAAIYLLDELLDDVCFTDEASRAVALSALLTAVIRPSLPAAPMHVVTAPMPGSGKSYLVDLIALVATGRRAKAVSAGTNDDEFEKRLASALMAGESFISLDNVTRPINGELICSLLTQERVSVRLLGKSEMVEIRSSAFLMLNGNNVQIPADMTRRVVQCSLDTKVGDPEHLTRNTDAQAAVLDDRGAFVSAILTVLRGYIAAGRPCTPPALGSFDEWGLVRGALVWLGYADPVSSMAGVRAADPRRAERNAIMQAWAAVFGDSRRTVAEAIQAASFPGDLRDALLTVAGERGVILPMRLGKWLGRNAGVRLDDLYFEPAGQRRGAALWTLRGATAASEVKDIEIGQVLHPDPNVLH